MTQNDTSYNKTPEPKELAEAILSVVENNHVKRVVATDPCTQTYELFLNGKHLKITHSNILSNNSFVKVAFGDGGREKAILSGRYVRSPESSFMQDLIAKCEKQSEHYMSEFQQEALAHLRKANLGR